MRVRFVSAAVAAMLATTVPLQADTSKFCKRVAGQPTLLDYQAVPSMVVHDDTLSLTYADLGMANETGGPTSEGVFSFSRTINSLLRSARLINENTPADARRAARIALVQTMLDSFDNNDGLALNTKSGVSVPVEDRRTETGGGVEGEGSLSAAALLDFADADFGLQPRALFNRFDLAPETRVHCGEYRVVYSLRDPGNEFKRRFLLIFEAMVPNPYSTPVASGGEAGCRPMTEFWAGLSHISGDAAAQRLERAKRLSELYYRGVEGVTSADGTGPANPVLSFRHLGGDGGRGQVRANMFFQKDWQLREWLVQLTGSGLGFVPETVKDNPIAELYKDDLSGTALAASNIPGVLQELHGDFVSHFMTTVQDNLSVERSAKYKRLAGRISEFNVTRSDGTTPITEDDLLVTVVGLQSDDRFNEFQSVSNPPNATSQSDEPSLLAGPIFMRTLELLNRHRLGKDKDLQFEAAKILVARAEAGTCAGCHQTSPRDGIQPAPAVVKAVGVSGTPVTWPDTVPKGFGFVHVSELRNSRRPFTITSCRYAR